MERHEATPVPPAPCAVGDRVTFRDGGFAICDVIVQRVSLETRAGRHEWTAWAGSPPWPIRGREFARGKVGVAK